MSWTTDYPTKPGFYWIRNWGDISPRDQIVEVMPSGSFYQTGDDWPYVKPDADGAEWQGPIEAQATTEFFSQIRITCRDCGESDKKSFVSWNLGHIEGRQVFGVFCRDCWIKRLTPEQRKVYMV